MSDPCLNWEGRMTSQEAAKHHLTGGLVAVELYRAAVADADALRRQLAQAQEQIKCEAEMHAKMECEWTAAQLSYLEQIATLKKDVAFYAEWDAYAAGVLVARQNDGSLPPFPVWDDVQPTATAVDEDDSHCLCRAEVWQLEQQIAALKADLAGVSETVGWASTLLDLSTRTINEMWADKAKAAEAWENLKYWRGLITWDSRVGGGDGKELDRLKAYFEEETSMSDLKPCCVCDSVGLAETAASLAEAEANNDWIECSECGHTAQFVEWQSSSAMSHDLRRERDALRARVEVLEKALEGGEHDSA